MSHKCLMLQFAVGIMMCSHYHGEMMMMFPHERAVGRALDAPCTIKELCSISSLEPGQRHFLAVQDAAESHHVTS